jgi:hypothetical protein
MRREWKRLFLASFPVESWLDEDAVEERRDCDSMSKEAAAEADAAMPPVYRGEGSGVCWCSCAAVARDVIAGGLYGLLDEMEDEEDAAVELVTLWLGEAA